MNANYNKLWKLLIDNNMKKQDLNHSCGISWSSISKLSKGEKVSMDVLMRICKFLNCSVGDILEFTDEKQTFDNSEKGVR